MNFKEIKELILLINESEIAEFKIREGEFELTIRSDDYHKGRTTVMQSAAPSATLTSAFVQPSVAPAPSSLPAPAANTFAEAPAADPSAGLLEVRSPMVGTFYRSPSVDKPPYVKVGDSIDKGKVVCIVEAMKLFNEIESEVKGKIVKMVVEDATPVEFDQVLFLVDPNG